MFKLGATLSALSAELLDQSIQFSIDTNNFRSEGLRRGWTVFRDLSNMVFIFILVYIAFATILQLSNFNTKRTLAVLIVVALLLNFSFFLTGIVIDISNVLGTFLYDAMTNNKTEDLGTQFQTHLALQNIQESTRESVDTPSRILFLIGGAVFLFISAFVFLAGAILFALRTVGLFIVLALSPIAFAAAILPRTREYWNRWLSKLFNLSFLLPIYLLLTAIVLLIITGGEQATGSLVRGLIDQQNPDTNYISVDNVAVILSFILISTLLIAALSISQKMGGEIGKLSVKWAGKFTGLTAGGVGLLYRQTGGRLSRRVRDSDRVASMMKSENKFVRRLGQFTRQSADYGAKARGDVRAGIIGKTVAGTAGAALGAGGIKIQTGRPPRAGGYDAQRARQVGARVKRAGDEQEMMKRKIRGQAEQEGQALGQTPEQIKGVIDKQMGIFRKQQAEDLERRGPISTVTLTTAANREAAEVLRGRREPPAPPQAGFTAEQTREFQDMMRRAREENA